MASSEELNPDIVLGRNLTVVHRFFVGITVPWVYDYFLTLSDEIEYIWSGKASSVLVLFILNRYWPLWSLLWILVAYFGPDTQSRCDKTAWLSMIYYVFATLFAQLAITLRVYAVTGKNRWIASCLSFMSFAQAALGTASSIHSALLPAVVFPNLPFDEYRACAFQFWETGEVIYVALSLSYDALALLIIVYSAKHHDGGRARVDGMPSLLDKILQDATVYFLVLSTGHLLLLFFEVFASTPIKTLPGDAMIFIMPLMVTRLILSLKKAAKSPSTIWSAGQVSSIMFARRTIGGTERGGDVPLRSFVGKRRLASEL